MTDFANLLNSLNPQQREAVEAIEGPVLVIAGPGTGKTQVLAMRIANILQSTDAKPRNILCLTFTESGVAAMRKRLQQIIGSAAYYVNIHTFHSFCNEVIQAYPDKFPEFRENPIQLTDLDRIKVIRRVIDGLDLEKKWNLRPYSNKYQYQYEIISSIQTLKREGILPEDLQQVAAADLAELQANPKLNRKGEPTIDWTRSVRSAERNVELGEVYQAYQEVLTSENYYDYEDMILFVLKHFAEDDELLAHYQEQFLYILVDEYQDTNGAQNQIIKHLGSFDPSPNIFAVGDDDQAIYRFQGANVDNLLFFNQQFANVRHVTLTTNYRSSQAILDAAGNSIAHNHNRLVNLIPNLDKNLRAAKELRSIKPEIAAFSTGDKENEFLIKQIKQLIDQGIKASEIAILYRKHSDAEDLIDAFMRAELPIKVATGSNALDEEVVQQMLNMFKIISFESVDRDKLMFDFLFYEFIQKQFAITRLGAFQMIKFVNDVNYYAKTVEDRLSIFEAMSGRVPLPEYIAEEDQKKFAALASKVLEWRSLASNTSLVQFSATVLEESGFNKFVFRTDSDIEQINAVNSFFNFIKSLNRQHREASLHEFLNDVVLLQENGLSIKQDKLDIDEEGINLLTAHGSKGLEYKYVFMVKAYHGNWGGRRNRELIKLPAGLFNLTVDEAKDIAEKDLETEDERRLFFVAMTRAQERLYISYAQSYVTNGNTKEVEPSQFVTEFNSQLVDIFDTAPFEEADVQYMRTSLSPIVKPDMTAAEEKFLRGLVSDFRLSASSLNAFMACPLQFKFTYLLDVPLPPSEPLSLGNSVHKALEMFMRKRMAGEEANLGYIMTVFHNALERELLGGEQYARVLQEGRDILERYYEYYKDQFPVPAAVEYSFNHRVVMELPDQDPVLLTGKIDRIDWIDKQNNLVKIIDYKTTTPKSENEIKGLTKAAELDNWRQIVFYHLLAEMDERFAPAGSMNKYRVDHAEIDFLKQKDGKFRRVELSVTYQDINELKQDIARVIWHIRNLKFYGTEEFPLCTECESCQNYANIYRPRAKS